MDLRTCYRKISKFATLLHVFKSLAQSVVCLPLVQLVRGSMPGEVEDFIGKILNLGARSGGDEQFLITIVHLRPELNSKSFRNTYVAKANCTVYGNSFLGLGR